MVSANVRVNVEMRSMESGSDLFWRYVHAVVVCG